MFSFTNLETICVGMRHLTWWTKMKKELQPQQHSMPPEHIATVY